MPSSITLTNSIFFWCQWFLISSIYHSILNKCLHWWYFSLNLIYAIVKCLHTFLELSVDEKNSSKGLKQPLSSLTGVHSVLWALSLKLVLVTQTRDMWEEENLAENSPVSDCPEAMSVGIFLISDWCRKICFTVGGATFELVVLDCVNR